jgi:hypothetical protein
MRIVFALLINKETAGKEVQDTSCRGSGGVPQFKKSPKIGGYRGLIKVISAVSIMKIGGQYFNIANNIE